MLGNVTEPVSSAGQMDAQNVRRHQFYDGEMNALACLLGGNREFLRRASDSWCVFLVGFVGIRGRRLLLRALRPAFCVSSALDRKGSVALSFLSLGRVESSLLRLMEKGRWLGYDWGSNE